MHAKEFTIWGGVRRLDVAHPAIAAAFDSIHDGTSWRTWRATWREAYKAIAVDIRSTRARMRDGALSSEDRSAAQSRRHSGRVAAANMMLLLTAAKARRPIVRKAV